MKTIALFFSLGTLWLNAQPRKPFTVVEATIPEMRAALEQKRVTSRELVTQYLIRIATYEHTLHAAVTVNPNALKDADAMDRERASGKVRGPLHGIPIALKDNIHTTDMPTTGGALAFRGFVPPYEATLTKNLRDAGAIIIAKTTLIELANWVAGAPTPMPAYNAVAGFGFNPYDPRPDPRETPGDGRAVLSPGGSSSGAGTASSLWAANVGSDTGGSIINPSNQSMLVGIRPTLGRISRYGVIPITADHDTAGPMTRTVTDAAIMTGGARKRGARSPRRCDQDSALHRRAATIRKFLKADGLKGARIGIPRTFYYDRAAGSGGGGRGRGGLNPAQAKSMEDAIEVLKQQGAVIVDPAEIPSFVEKDPKNNFTQWPVLLGSESGQGQRRGLLSQFQVRNEARLQQLAGELSDLRPR